MLSRIPIRWRITLFHILTMLGIFALLAFGMFWVFGVAVNNMVEELARSRANEAARIVETTGDLTDVDLARLNREGVSIIAVDAEGRVVAQIGGGQVVGEQSDSLLWQAVLNADDTRGGQERGIFEAWDDAAVYAYAVPVNAEGSTIRVIEANANYDHVGQDQFMWVTFAFIGFGILTFLLITLGSIWLVRYSLAPVTAIARSASAIGAADLSQRLPVRSRRDELGQLAITFNKLLDRLETAFHEREEALAHQRRFVADASHELRTPLTSILGYTRLLKQWGLTHPDASAEAVARMEAEAARMQSLVEGLLQLARGDEAGELPLVETDIGEIVLEAVSDATAGGDPTIHLELPDEPALALANPDALRQVASILIDNAFKHSPPGGEVTVHVDSTPAAVTFAVSDCGPGIAPEHQPRIFERFYRVEQARSTRGAGLGLAIAKDIVDGHGGEIAVVSEPGHGATFTVRLPKFEDGERGRLDRVARP